MTALLRARAGFAAGEGKSLQVESSDSKPAAIILFGSPGSGKGTQAKLLGESIAGPHISTGDMLRKHIEAGDEIGLKAQSLIKAGKLVPDEMVNILVEKRLEEPDVRKGMILDGYPRTVNQAKVLLKLMDQEGFVPSVVHLVVDYEKIVARLSGRRQCPVCGTLYSLTTSPPKVAGICDRDGAALVTREDDREVVIRERLHEYDVQTVPILNFFRESGVPLFEVNAGDATPEQVRQRVCEQLLVRMSRS
jgi:adenylate kinase